MASIRPHDLPSLPARSADSHKFDYGRVVVIGGSVGMAGAPALSAMAAIRSGAGLVELLVPETVAVVAAGFDPCVMTLGLASAAGCFAATAAGEIMVRATRADAVAFGPGLGRSEDVAAIAKLLWRECPKPCVFDADALFAIGSEPAASLANHAGPRILTPHEGEMRRLLRCDDRPPRGDLERLARDYAAATGSVVVLKGPRTLIASAGAAAHNTTGNPGMATAGAGDVLTGVVAALVAQKLSPFDAARLAAWVHGRAGDLAAAAVGQVSLVATDILHSLPAAFREISPPPPSPSV